MKKNVELRGSYYNKFIKCISIWNTPPQNKKDALDFLRNSIEGEFK